jgi:CubicO group peptidase (beta-lactamase class C family)
MKYSITLLLTIGTWLPILAQSSDLQQIRAVLIDYIQGTSNGEIHRLEKAFHPNLNLYAVDNNKALKVWKGKEYIKAFTPGETTNRIGQIISIDYENNAAIAKVEIASPNNTFIDYFLLLKLKEGWKIIHKSYTSKTDLAGQSFSFNSAVKELEKVMHSFLEKKQAAGGSFAISKNNESPISKHFGYADLKTKKQVGDKNQFPIASLTKIFISTAILKLVEAGKLSLNDDLKTYFPNYPNGENISIEQMLNHTAGIKAWYFSELPEDTPKDFPNCPQPHKYIQRMVPQSDFEPGNYYNYSNTSFVLLAEIIEMLSKKSLQDYLSDIIFQPLKMKNTANYTAINKQYKVIGYEFEDHILRKVNIQTPFGAGSIYATAPDLLLFMNALKSGKIISKANYNRMISYGLLSNRKKSNTAPYFNSSQSSSLWKDYGYGLGMEIVNFDDKLMHFHSGLVVGGQALLVHFPHNDISFSIVMNTQGRFPELNDALLKIVSRINN